MWGFIVCKHLCHLFIRLGCRETSRTHLCASRLIRIRLTAPIIIWQPRSSVLTSNVHCIFLDAVIIRDVQCQRFRDRFYIQIDEIWPMTFDLVSEVRRLCMSFWRRSVVFHAAPCKVVSWESLSLPYLHAESRYSTADKWLLIWHIHDTQTYKHIQVSLRIQLYILTLGIICCIDYELGEIERCCSIFSGDDETLDFEMTSLTLYVNRLLISSIFQTHSLHTLLFLQCPNAVKSSVA